MSKESTRALAWAAYEQGWRDACFDHMEQEREAQHHIGESKKRDIFSLLHILDPRDLLRLGGKP